MRETIGGVASLILQSIYFVSNEAHPRMVNGHSPKIVDVLNLLYVSYEK